MDYMDIFLNIHIICNYLDSFPLFFQKLTNIEFNPKFGVLDLGLAFFRRRFIASTGGNKFPPIKLDQEAGKKLEHNRF